ncbi:MAG: helix-turn-helix domain-containing protein [Actinobacteria bacterium]|nr:helix-turn-helix domain-containing protein [Actinomycetota bacterium]
MPADPSPAERELERLRLENETLSAVASVVGSGPDLAHILDRVVDLLTKATDCHACFIYLAAGERLELRAASPIYTHLVSRVSFGVDEGLAGWTMARREPAFIREGAIEDPRTVYVPELEEERFQSMVAVPILARAGESIGAIVLHTVAPREFDEGILNILSRTASLVSGAIENARLYEEAQERVSSLTQLSALGREIAAVADRGSLLELAAAGVRELIEADLCRIYEADDSETGLRLVAAAPAMEGPPSDDEVALVMELVEARGEARRAVVADLATKLGLEAEGAAGDSVSLMASGRRLGALLVLSRRPWRASAPELLRAAAQQVALAVQRTELIERLTEENLARDLFDALSGGHLELAAEKAAAAGIDLRRPHIVLEALPSEAEIPAWSEHATTVEKTVKRTLPEALCDIAPSSLRALAPIVAEGIEPVRPIIGSLLEAAGSHHVAIGISEGRRGLDGLAGALREASDAARIAALLGGERNVLPYRDTGAYRYLIDLIDSGGPEDHLRTAVEAIAGYDRERQSQLLRTLDEYLTQGRGVASTARALIIHVNTLRQRLDRIEQLTGLSLEEEDLLALQLAVKLGQVREQRR